VTRLPTTLIILSCCRFPKGDTAIGKRGAEKPFVGSAASSKSNA
jgi:hypothetical protein